MPDLADGESIEMQGSAATPYVLKNSGGVYSCTCPAWRNQGRGIEKRSCKHLVKLRGAAEEEARTGAAQDRAVRPARAAGGAATEDDAPSKAPPLLLAHPWAHDVDLTGWWMSEKLDGIRGYWDGTQFISRLGNRFFAPKWFVEALPRVPLDGELWSGRKKFQRTNGIVRRQDESDLWHEISFLVFDAPAHEGPFEERLAYVAEHVAAANVGHLKSLEHARCEGIEHLKRELARVEGLGGEGLMMRKPASRYEVGRSHTLLKVKTFKDAEARVVDYVAGAGKHKGKVGALLLELPDGTRFSAGTGLSDAERANPPEKGAIVTFRYQELSDAGVPRFPSYVGIRYDFAWPGEKARRTGGEAEDSSGPDVKAGKTPEQPGKTGLEAGKTGPEAGKTGLGAGKTASGAGKTTEQAGKTGLGAGKTTEQAGKTAPAAGPTGSARRRYTFVEGNSSKFWETWVEGTRMFVRFGRIDTAGQTKLKDFATADEAQRGSNALVAEKLKKGYEPAS